MVPSEQSRRGIVVVGSLNLDLVVSAPRFPGPGETVAGKTFRQFYGGKGANQAFAAAKLGAAVTMLGQVGHGPAGEMQLQNLAAAGVQTHWVGRDPGQPSGTAVIVTDGRGENRIIVIPGANGTFEPAALKKAAGAFARAAWVLVQLEIPMATVEAAARLARQHGARVILDPAPAMALSNELLEASEYVTPNLSELKALTGRSMGERAPENEIAAAARVLCRRGASKVLVKLGRRGAMLVTSAEVSFWPAHKVAALDTTAAGDAFNGAFATELAAGSSESRAGAFATAAAAVSVTRAGAQASLPTRAEVEAFLEALR